MTLNRDEIKKFIKFSFTGAMNTIVDWSVFTVFYNFMGVDELISQVIGSGIAILNSYTINRLWTFKTREKFFSLSFLKFIVVNLISIAFSTGLLALFTKVVFVDLPFSEKGITYFSKFWTIPFVVTINFIGNRLWTFRDRSTD